nr:transposase [Poseidonocella sp. HB161398]
MGEKAQKSHISAIKDFAQFLGHSPDTATPEELRANRRSTAEQHIREGKYAIRWTRLSCRRFRDNEARLQLHALAYNLAVFLANVGLPEPMDEWSLTSLQLKLIKIGARVVWHARAITFQLAEVAVSGPMVRAVIAAIQRLRAPPAAT